MVELINNKLRLPLRINQFNTHLVQKLGCKATKKDSSGLLNNHWFAGVVQGRR